MANSTTYYSGRHNGHSDSDHADSSRIREHIEHTRREMDHTLEEIGERLHPKHLLDYALDYVRSTSARATAEDAGIRLRSVANEVSCKVKEHPMPAALITSGLLWWLFERDDDAERRSRGSLDSARKWYAGENARYTRQHLPAWHSDYDWTQAEEDEETWTQKAKIALDSIKTSLSDTTKSAVDKVRGVSASLVDLSGHRREKLHSQWADLKEHSGSFVDARTGEPYDDSYGEEWRNLHAAHCVANCKDEETESWRDKASNVVEGLRESLSKSGDNMPGALQSMSSKIGEFAGSIGGYSSELGLKASERAGAMWDRTASGARRMSESARDVGARAQERLGEGYRHSRDYLSQEMHEHPLAVGVAALALGMLAGFVLPRTESEDRIMGEVADDFKDQVKDQAATVANEAMERGQKIAEATSEVVTDEARKQGVMPEHV